MKDYKSLYEHISKRKSTRRFIPEPLSPNQLYDIQAYLKQLDPLLPMLNVDFKVVSSEAIRGAFAVKAPHYIVVSSNEKTGHLMNIGFMLQQLDLYVASLGLGGCWVGMAKPSKELLEQLPHDFVIAYALGTPQGAVHQDLDQFNRNPITEISEGQGFESLIEAARLAPSSTNSQPWYFVVKPNRIDLYRVKNNPLKGFFLDKMNQIDIGIALCHIYLAAKAEGLHIACAIEIAKTVDAIQGYYYMISCELTKE